MRMLSVASAVLVLSSVVACTPTPPASATATAASAPAPAAAPATAQAANGFNGSIAETMDSGGYTYAKLKGANDEVWVAAPVFDAKVGETVSVSLDMPMANFQSKTLNRTFEMLYFVQAVARNGQPLMAVNTPAGPQLSHRWCRSSIHQPVASRWPTCSPSRRRSPASRSLCVAR
jgi:hypothetical protein